MDHEGGIAGRIKELLFREGFDAVVTSNDSHAVEVLNNKAVDIVSTDEDVPYIKAALACFP